MTVVNVTATGTGISLLQVCSQYNIKELNVSPRFIITPTILDSYSVDRLNLQICSSYIPLDSNNRSSSVEMEITLPSGFVADKIALQGLVANNRVIRAYTENSDTKIIIYFVYLDTNSNCITVKGDRVFTVMNRQPSTIVLTDCYESNRKAVVHYQLPDVN